MVIILVHWMIKKGEAYERAFKEKWRSMTIAPNIGLYREILTQPMVHEDAKFNTFSLTDQAYATYINVGIWEDVESFDEAVGKYIQAPEARIPESGSMKGREMMALYMEDFEFKLRERIILSKLWDRQGQMEFGPPDLS